MTAQELIAALQKVRPDTTVYVGADHDRKADAARTMQESDLVVIETLTLVNGTSPFLVLCAIGERDLDKLVQANAH